jgi:hypothetical protein
MLFHQLATAARAAGIERFVAETLPENHKMLGLFAATGLVTGQTFNNGTVDVTMTLPDIDEAVASRMSGSNRAHKVCG